MPKRRLHWAWRGAAAIVAGLAVHAVCVTYSVPTGFWGGLFMSMGQALSPWVGEAWAVGIPDALLTGIPSLVVAFGTYGLLGWGFACRESDGETHCRACNHILRSLSEPRCPECGERI